MKKRSPGTSQNVFGKIGTMVSSLFARDTSVIGIDIGSSSLKVVQLKKKGGKAVLDTYGEIALGPYGGLSIGQATQLPEEAIQEALFDVIREAGVGARTIGVAVPLASSFISIMELPSAAQDRLKEMVPIEARKYISLPIAEVALDWKQIRQEPGVPAGAETTARKKIQILISAISRDVMSTYRRMFMKTELEVTFFEIEVFAAMRSLLRREKKTVLLLDLGAGSTKMSLVKNGIILKTRWINKGAQDLTMALSRSHSISVLKAEEMKRTIGISDDPQHRNVSSALEVLVDNIFTDAHKMLTEYEQKTREPVDRVILSGGGAQLKGIISVAEKNFKTPIELADPFRRVETPAVLASVVEEVGPSFTVAVGVALRKLQETQ